MKGLYISIAQMTHNRQIPTLSHSTYKIDQ
uniref:Uncharacterized protein n=1 Tax=Anguilla anguilla TaxID=7936 RepID=A0A0E9PP00_ANGAN